MKLVKYVTSFLLFFMVLIFVGEIYVWNLESFETEYAYVTFYQQKDTTDVEMLSDISKAAKNENVGVFVVDRKVTSLFSESIKIYTTDENVEKTLINNTGVKTGSFESIFLGTVNVEFYDWTEIPNINKVENYYVMGDDEDIINFKRSLVDKYAGRFPQEGYQAINSKLSVSMMWICLTSFLLLLTFYEVAHQKKDIMLRITIGEQIELLILKQIVLDVLVYFVMYKILIHNLSHYTNTFFLSNVSNLLFGIFLVVNSLAYLWLLWGDYKKDIQTKENEKKVLKISYVYKMVTSIMIIVIMTGCIQLIYNGINCYKQKTFFESKKEYSYITVGGRSLEDAQNILRAFYHQGAEDKKVIGLINLGKWHTDAEYILANEGALEYLSICIPEIQDYKLEDKMYYLIPEKYLKNEDILEDMLDISYAYYQEEYDYEIIGYEETAAIMAISNTGKIESAYKKNPIIILNKTEDMWLPNNSIFYISNAIMYSFSEHEFEEVATLNCFEDIHYQTNVYENYMYYWNVTKRNMLMGVVLLIILLIIEGLILRSILKYEYRINAVELLLSKIHGNSFVCRHKRIIMLLLGGWLSLFISIVVCLVLKFSGIWYVFIGGGLVLSMEHLFVMIYSHKLDNVSINKIFKGGIL